MMVASQELNTHELRLSYFERVWVPQLRRKIRRRGLLDPYAQEAILQAVRVRIWRNPPNCEDPKAISKATTHSLIDYLRQQKSQAKMEATQCVSEEHMRLLLNGARADQPGITLEQVERREAIETQLKLLPPESAAIVRRHYFAGESLAQIGESLGVSEGTVSKRLKAIRYELAKCASLRMFAR